MFDLVIFGGDVADGTGAPRRRTDIGVLSGRIAAVGDLHLESARRSIDATGLVVCPGFIDIHAHSDLQPFVDPAHEAKVRQGVTLEVNGQDGLSYAPTDDKTLEILKAQLRGWNNTPDSLDWNWRSVGEYLDRVDETDTSTNFAYLVPHGTVRLVVMGADDRVADDTEIRQMAVHVEQGLADGALGLSTGLTYTPAVYADARELEVLTKTTALNGGYFTPHIRSYGRGALEAYSEMIGIAQRSGVAVHFAHAALSFPINEGRAPELIAMVDGAVDRGIDVSMDSYPYTAGATYLHALLPSWCLVGGPSDTLKLLNDHSQRARLRTAMEETGSDGFQGVPADWGTVVVSGVSLAVNEEFVGLTIEEVSKHLRMPPFDAFVEVLIRDRLGSSCVLHIGIEENVRAIMQHPAQMFGSDGILVGGRPHPRGWGTFPRVLGRYSRDLSVLTLEQAIHKMTGLPSARLGLADRGLIASGMAADLVCFDPDSIADTATFENPRRHPIGIPYVVVSGSLVIDDDVFTGRMPGSAIRSIS
jgi:N-acyl-D-amino-acid deacylase